MKKYFCVKCCYSTDDYSNYTKHTTTIKHKKNIKKRTVNNLDNTKKMFSCVFCNFTSYYQSSYSRHKKMCKNIATNNNINMLIDINKLKVKNNVLEEINELKNKIIEKDNENRELLKSQMKDYKDIINYGKSVKSMLKKHFKDNPPIRELDCSMFDNYIKPKKKLIEEMLSEFRHKTLHIFLGEFILSIYKKNNNNDQSIFGTDISRLNYVIKEIIDNKESEWILDKKGIKTTKYIISPLLNHIKKILEEYICDDEYKKLSGYLTVDQIKKRREALEILSHIDDKKLEICICKFISPLFIFDYDSINGTKKPELN